MHIGNKSADFTLQSIRSSENQKHTCMHLSSLLAIWQFLLMNKSNNPTSMGQPTQITEPKLP